MLLLIKVLKLYARNKRGTLKRVDGRFTVTGQEILKVLVETHFPDSKEIDTCPEEGWQSDLEPCRVNRENWNLLQQIVNRIKLRWAIKSFDPYKSAGPDLIIPAFLSKELMFCHHFFVEFLEPV